MVLSERVVPKRSDRTTDHFIWPDDLSHKLHPRRRRGREHADRNEEVLSITVGDQIHQFDDAFYDSASPPQRRAAERRLAHAIGIVCASGSTAAILRTVQVVVERRSALRHLAAVSVLESLLSGDPPVRPNRRAALLLLLVGAMDSRQDRDTEFARFLQRLSGLRRAGTALDRLLTMPVLTRHLSPATVSLLALFSRFTGLAGTFDIGVQWMKRNCPGHADVSWPLALRLGLFMLERVNPYEHGSREAPAGVVTAALAMGLRDGTGRDRDRALIVKAMSGSRWFASIARQVTFEDDPTCAPARNADPPARFRHVRPARDVDVILGSDGSEIIGYRRSPQTGDVIGITREQPRPGHRDPTPGRRWNNEPIRRAHFADALVSPTGLVLFGDNAILDFEFANQVNRSGAALDSHQLNWHRDLVLSGDRSAAVTDFPVLEAGKGFLLSGFPNLRNYGHFIINGISKLALHRAHYGPDWTIVVPTRRAPFHDAILRYCGYDPAAFLFTNREHGIRCRQLDVIAEAPAGIVSHNLFAAFRATLPEPGRGSGPRRIYVARPAGASRPLTNEDAIIKAMLDLDFEVLHPEELPFDRQVAAFEAADIIVAPHGSALFTLWFCFGAKRIVEIKTKEPINLARYTPLGHQVVQVPSRRIQSRAPSAPVLSYEADMKALLSAVRWAIGER